MSRERTDPDPVCEEDLRRRYAATRVHHPFERVAAAFEASDLAFLLTDTNSLKITYLADHKDLPVGAHLRQWVDFGLIASHARLASQAGYTPKTLGESIDLARSIGPRISRQAWLETLITHPTPKQYLSACAEEGFDGPWLVAAIESRASLPLLRSLRKLGVPPRYLTAQIVAGCPDASSILAWFSSGISPWATAQLINAGLNAGQALAWLQTGFIPSEIVKNVSDNKSIEECKSDLPNVTYSKAFRRYGENLFGIAGTYVGRVFNAVKALDVPSTYHSSMFSSAKDETFFLDGGYVSVAGYGFGSHSYVVVRGEMALRFLCNRIGVRQPKTTANKQLSIDKNLIETLFFEWRANAISRK